MLLVISLTEHLITELWGTHGTVGSGPQPPVSYAYVSAYTEIDAINATINNIFVGPY